jgi:hypothetical protein
VLRLLSGKKRKVVGSDIEFGYRKESLSDLIDKLDSNYQILYSMIEKEDIDKDYLELLAITFKSNVEKIYTYLNCDKNDSLNESIMDK